MLIRKKHKRVPMIGTLTGKEIHDVLSRNIVGRIGCTDGKKTYVVPINYVFNGKDIIAHSLEGMKIQMMRKNPAVCFEVDEMADLTNWQSVIAWGVYQELKDERERYAAMKLFVDRMIHMKLSRDAASKTVALEHVHGKPGSSRPVIYRILLHELSGRYEKT